MTTPSVRLFTRSAWLLEMSLLVCLEESVTAKLNSNGPSGDVMLAANVIDRLSLVDGVLQVAARDHRRVLDEDADVGEPDGCGVPVVVFDGHRYR